MFLETLLNTFETNSKRNAFCIGELYYTYEQLYKSVYSIKKQIGNIDLNDNYNVAVICSDDLETYSSILAIWFSGFTYIPLGIHNPLDRNISILEDSNTRTILSTIELDEVQYSGYTIIKPIIEEYSNPKLVVSRLNIESLAYILYTSGSTGVPKGVPISYHNLDEFVNNFQNSPFKICSEDRCLQMFELTFDVSISSFLVPLMGGACVYTVPNNVIKYIYVLKLLQSNKLTSIQIVPSIIKLAKQLLSKLSFPDLRNCILTGEATHIDLLTGWIKAIPNAKVYNYYGPTETTIYCSYYDCNCDKLKSYNGMLAIGRPLGNMKLFVVDGDFKEVGEGIKGELLISGDQVTRGYLNNFLRNRESFTNLTLGGVTTTFYRSGDLCYKDKDDDIYYCDRMDSQVKVQGFRVELSEIEVLVRKEFNINNIVLLIENRSGTNELVLFIEDFAHDGNNSEAVISFLKSKLPQYMLPGKVIYLKNFPLGSSGKTDKNQLRELVGNGFKLN